MSEERKEMSFGDFDNFGIVSTDKVAAVSIRGFLDSNPDEITSIEDEPAKKVEPKIEKKKTFTKEAEKKEEEEVKQKEPTQEDLINLLSEDSEEEEDTKEEEGEEDSTTGKQNTDNIFPALSEEMFDLGIFVRTEEDGPNVTFNTPEEFASRFRLEGKRTAINELESFLSRFGDDYYDMFNAVFSEGVHPRDYIEKYSSIEDIENFDISDEHGQERLVRELLREEGRSHESISSRIEKLKNYGDLKDEAEEAKSILSERRREALNETIEQKARQNALDKRKKMEYMTNVNTILTSKLQEKEYDGIPLTETVAKQTFQYLTSEKYQTPDGKRFTEFDKDILELTRPENHGLKVKMGMLMQLLKTDPSLSSIKKKTISKEANNLFSRINKQADTKITKKESKSTPNTWFP